jgi:hypothetical protein
MWANKFHYFAYVAKFCYNQNNVKTCNPSTQLKMHGPQNSNLNQIKSKELFTERRGLRSNLNTQNLDYQKIYGTNDQESATNY